MTKIFGPKAEVCPHNGSPALYVNGTPIPPMAYTGHPDLAYTSKTTRPEYLKELGKCGIRVYYVTLDLDWFKSGSFEVLRKKVNFILDNVPEAYIILRTKLHPPVQWLKDHPEELVAWENWEPVKPLPSAGMPQEYESIGMYSLASAKWREDGGKVLSELIGQIERNDLAQHVIGFFLCAGGSSEWYYPHVTFMLPDEHYTDNSSTFKQNFSRILKETYMTDDRLRVSWNDPQASFDNPKIPNLNDRYFSRIDDDILASYRKDPKHIISLKKGSNIGSFLNPDTHQFVADYYKALHFGTADSIIHFAHVIKDRTQNTKVVGAFYGSYGCTHFQETGTVSGVVRILDSGYIDFLSAPGNYENRQPGGVTAQREMQDSFRIRNRIFIVEEDTRTHLANEINRNFTGTHTLEDSLTNMKRDFGRNLSENLYGWWFDMAPKGGWYDHPKIISLIKRQQEVAKKSYEFDRQIDAEIAIIYDEESTWYTSQRTLVDLCHMMRGLEIHRIGAPVAYHFHNDLSLKNMPEYKLYIFLNVFVLSDQEREVINQRVKTSGKAALWVYASGIINPDRQPRFSLEHISELTGMKVGSLDIPTYPACRIIDDGDGILSGIQIDKEYGYFNREMFGNVANIQSPGLAWSTLLYPCIYGNDSQVRVLGRFTANGQPALIARDFGKWRSIHACFKAIRSDILRSVARYAGCHIYSESDDILYANRNFVTLHASTGGEKVIKLPGASNPFEIYECKSYGISTREIRFTIKKGETKTFYLHSEI